MSQEATFKKNGGYFIDGVAYMDCRETGEPVANVSLTSTSVMGSRALVKVEQLVLVDLEVGDGERYL